jgi:hypothetical protein
MAYDKREFHRFRSIVLNVEFKHSPDRYFSSVEIADVSTGGLCFLTNTNVRINDNLTFQFSFSSNKILMSGKVARINGREVGVQFTDNEEEIQKFINLYNLEASRISKEIPGLKNSRIIPEKTDKSLNSDKIGSMLEIDL